MSRRALIVHAIRAHWNIDEVVTSIRQLLFETRLIRSRRPRAAHFVNAHGQSNVTPTVLPKWLQHLASSTIYPLEEC